MTEIKEKATITKYTDLISTKLKDAVNDIQLGFKAKKEGKRLESLIVDLESTIADDEANIQEQKSSLPINWDSLIESIDNLELNQRKLELLKDLQKELF